MCAGFNRTWTEHAWVMLAHDQNLGSRDLFAKKTRHIESAQAGHAYVYKNKIGPEFHTLLNCLRPVFCFAADFPVGLLRQDIRDAASDPFVVVGDENSHTVLIFALTRDYHPGGRNGIDNAGLLDLGSKPALSHWRTVSGG